MKGLRSVIPLLLIAASAFGAEIQPQDEKGFTPERAYHLGDIDGINLYNGNLTIMIPIGPSYAVGGRLSYGLTLSYNSSVWNKEDQNVATPAPPHRCQNRRPSPDTNAGFGWNLTPTQLQIPCGKNVICTDPVTTSETFVSPDGGRHVFYPKLHDGDATSGVVGYTRDGTYARAKSDNGGHLIELPDGTRQRYELVPNTNRVRITDMLDGLGNWASFAYPTSNELDIADSQNRTQIVRYTSYASADESNLQQVPTEIELAASTGRTLLYTLNYTLTSIPRTDIFPANYYCDSESVTVPLLKTITVKEKNTTTILQTWSFSYYGETDDGKPKAFSGALKSMTVPTGGTYSYDYSVLALPASACDESSANPRVLRVAAKTITPSTAGASINSPMIWTYSAALRPQTQTVTLLCGIGNSWIDIPPEEEMTVTVDTPTKSRTVSYFSVWNQPFGSVYGNQKIENGLPLTRRVQYGATGEYLSTEEYDCSQCASGAPPVLMRSTYVHYERDERTTNGGFHALNKRASAQRTVFHDDPAGCALTACRYASTSYQQFDGIGHYRQTTSTSNFTGSHERTSFTNFNATTSTYALDANGSLIGNYVMPSETNFWLPNIYDEQWDEENNAAAKRVFEFDGTTGLLKSLRIFKDRKSSHGLLQPDSHDVYRTFCYSAGNVTNERHYGGDRAALPATLPAVCTGTAPNPANGEYEINHTYAGGVRATSRYAGSSIYFLNRTIDVPSGLPSEVKDTADVATGFEYDVLGRLTRTQPRDGAWTEIIYAGPDATTTKPTVIVNERPNGAAHQTDPPLVQSRFEYDGTGRLWRESQLMPSNFWSTRETTYDSSGLRRSVSEMGNPSANLTTFYYDSLGRQVKVHGPDGKEATTDYAGISTVNTHVEIATSKTASEFGFSTATTTQNLDERGRVMSVIEPNGVRTSYGYGIGGRLASVCMNESGGACGQTRSFVYDNRGFLLSETHPENGITDYVETDSRGHVWRRRNGASNGTFDLDMQYDSLERLRRVQKHGDQHALKVFDFQDINSAGEDAKGKLKRAIRYNWFSFGTAPVTTVNYQIVETYTYGGKDGRASARTTEEFNCFASPSDSCEALRTGTADRKFTQTFSYDELGHTSSIGYPAWCNQAGCTGVVAARFVSNVYNQGKLWKVEFPYAGTTKTNLVSYLPNGMVESVVHSNNVTDHVLSDSGMPRPKTLSTTGATDNASCVAPSISLQPSPSALQPGGSVVLSAIVSADTNTGAHPLSYQWYVGATGNTTVPISNSNTPNVTVQPSSTTSYWMRASNNCGPGGAAASADTVAAIVTVCTPPSFTTQPISRSITAGYLPATLSVSAAGSGLAYQWYEGNPGDTTRPVGGAAGPSLAIAPATTTTYWAAVANTCGTVNSSAATVTVYAAPATPANLVARLSGGAILLTWSAVIPPAGFGSYQVQRAVGGPGWSTAATGLMSATWTQSSPLAGQAYLFSVRIIDANGASSPWSAADVATNLSFTDDPILTIAQGGTTVRGIHVDQLRHAIDAVRATAGLAPQWTNYTPTGLILAQHINEMRQALYEARLHLGLPILEYTYSTIGYGSIIHGQDVTDLRNGVK